MTKAAINIPLIHHNTSVSCMQHLRMTEGKSVYMNTQLK